MAQPITAFDKYAATIQRDHSLAREQPQNGRRSLGSSTSLSSTSSLILDVGSFRGRSRAPAPPRWGDLERRTPSRLRSKSREHKQAGDNSSLPAVTPHRFRLSRASAPSPQPQQRQVLSRQERLLDRDRRHLHEMLAQTSELAAETSASMIELDNRHTRVQQLRDWREAEGFLL